jgi:hypothetical protein
VGHGPETGREPFGGPVVAFADVRPDDRFVGKTAV